MPVKKLREGVWGIKPRNREQHFALDLLLNDDIKLVTLVGKAGTGKTLLAIAAGLQKVTEEQVFAKLLVSRPIFPLGRDIGYLPGDIEEKLNPWMQPIYDNLELLLGLNKTDKKDGRSYAELVDMGFVEIEPLTYIRGRSLPNVYMIVDEAQNLTPHEVKTIITRAGEGTKIILTGDPVSDRPSVPRLVEQRAHDRRGALQERDDRRPRDPDEGRTLAARGAGDADPVKLVVALAVALGLSIAPAAVAGPGWELHVPERVEVAAGATGTLPIELSFDRGQTHLEGCRARARSRARRRRVAQASPARRAPMPSIPTPTRRGSPCRCAARPPATSRSSCTCGSGCAARKSASRSTRAGP